MSSQMIMFLVILAVPLIFWGIPALINRIKGPSTAHVTVISHRLELSKVGGAWYSDNWNRLVTFRLKDGSDLELYTTKQTYETIEDGQTGQLTWEQENLLYFDPDVSQ